MLLVLEQGFDGEGEDAEAFAGQETFVVLLERLDELVLFGGRDDGEDEDRLAGKTWVPRCLPVLPSPRTLGISL